MIQLANIIFVPERDAESLLQVPSSTDPAAMMQQLAKHNPQAVWVMTRGRAGSVAWMQGEVFQFGIFTSDEIGRLGGGDAFSAGFLTRYLQSPAEATPADVADALRWGAATSALKYSIPGDLPLMTRDEVLQLLASGSAASLRR
jgi:2-dehydro-3-deoxygluconokinase